MELPEKIKMTQKEFDDIYEIEGITGETEVSGVSLEKKSIPIEQDTTPEFLTEQETEIEKDYLEPLEGEIDG